MQALFPMYIRAFIRSNSILLSKFGILSREREIMREREREREVLLVFSRLHARAVLCIPEVNSLHLACSCSEPVSILLLLLLLFCYLLLLFVCLPLSVCYSFFRSLYV